MKNIDIKNSHKTSKNLSSENCLLSIYVKMLIIYIYIYMTDIISEKL